AGFGVYCPDGSESFRFLTVSDSGTASTSATTITHVPLVFHPGTGIAFAGDTPVVVPSGDIEESRARTERGRVPIRSALRAGLDVVTAHTRGSGFGRFDGPAPFIEPDIPVLLDECLAQEELTGVAVKHVEETVAARPRYDLARLTLPFDFAQHRDLHRIPVILVIRSELVIPFQLAGIGIEGEDTIGIEIVAAAARISVPAGIGIDRKSTRLNSSHQII